MDIDPKRVLATLSDEIKAGEIEKVQQICREMLPRLEVPPIQADLVNGFRSYFIETLDELRREGEPLDPLLKQLDLLFQGYLSTKNTASAAEVLVRKARILAGRSWRCEYTAEHYDACATAFKVIDRFGSSSEQAVMDAVNEAYVFLLEFLPGRDERYRPLLISEAKFLHRYGDCRAATSSILDSATGGWLSDLEAISMLEQFLSARSDQLNLTDEASIRFVLAQTYLNTRQFVEAIETCTWLLINSQDEGDLLDHLLWCGEAYMKLGRDQVGRMYLREVKERLGSRSDNDPRAKHLEVLMGQTA